MNVYVEHLAVIMFILGRDIIEAYGVVIDYQHMTCIIDSVTLQEL